LHRAQDFAKSRFSLVERRVEVNPDRFQRWITHGMRQAGDQFPFADLTQQCIKR